jgi:biotin carboxylase
MNPRRVMLLIPNQSYRAPDFMEAAARLDVEVVVGSDERNPLQETLPRRFVALNFADPDAGANQIEAFAEHFPLDTIVAIDDGGTRLAARASRRLELPHNPVAAVDATRNKALLRERLAAAGVASPWFRVIATRGDPRDVAHTIAFPAVIKPLSLSASRGVVRVDDEEQFVEAFERVKRIVEDPEAATECLELADRLLVEGYVPGTEVSLEGMLTSGKLRVLALFDKPDPLEGPYFEETIYVTPSRLPDDAQVRIAETAARAVAALGLSDGPVHVELRIDDDSVFPIDIAARSIGGLCSRTLSFGTAMSLEELILRHAIGAPVPSYDREGRAAGVMMIPIPRAGTLVAVQGVEEAEAVPLVDSVTITMHPGSKLVPLPEGGAYFGFIFASGEAPADVEAALRAAHAALVFQVA